MPHAAFVRLQQRTVLSLTFRSRSFNAARGFCPVATPLTGKLRHQIIMFQCRTRLLSGCNKRKTARQNFNLHLFQCRTRLLSGCNAVTCIVCPARGARAVWKVVDDFGVFSRIRANTRMHSIAVFSSIPCAARDAPVWKVRTQECGSGRSPTIFHFLCRKL